MIVIRRAYGCIGIYQLLIATIFIVPNSLLPFKLEENGFMNEYYEHPRVLTDCQHQRTAYNIKLNIMGGGGVHLINSALFLERFPKVSYGPFHHQKVVPVPL